MIIVGLQYVAGGLLELAEAHRDGTVVSREELASTLDRYARRLGDLIPQARAPQVPGRHYGADEQISRNRLIPGTIVRRYTEPAGGDQLDLRVPCCDRPARVRAGVDQAHALIGCAYVGCGLAYDATVFHTALPDRAVMPVVQQLTQILQVFTGLGAARLNPQLIAFQALHGVVHGCQPRHVGRSGRDRPTPRPEVKLPAAAALIAAE